MNNQQEPVETRQLLPEAVLREIDAFLTAKRRAVVLALAEEGELAQGDLAAKIGSPVTSLANITQKFEKFPHKLLESERSGKYRRYRLSELGKAYVEDQRQADTEPLDETLDDEERRLLRDAETSLTCFREQYKDDWRVKMDDALAWRIRSYKYLGDETGEKLVNRYLVSLEQLVMQESYAVYDKALTLLKDEILQTRAAAYMKRFQSLIPVLRHLEDQSISFDMRMMLRSAFNAQEASEAIDYIEAIGWEISEYNALKEAAKELRDVTAGYGEKQIYLLFQGLLPNLDDLSFYLAQLIYGQRTAAETKEPL